MKKINVVLLRGLLGKKYSKGMDVLGARLAKLPGVDFMTVTDYSAWRAERDRIRKWKDETVLIGHSFGSNAITLIAEQLSGVRFPLLISFDPSQYCSFWLLACGPRPIGSNVARAVNYYQNGLPIGFQKLHAPSGDVLNERVETTHTEIDDLTFLHDAAEAEVRKLF